VFAFAFSCWSIQAATYNEVGGVVVVESDHFDKRKDSEDDDHKWVIVPTEAAGTVDYLNARGGKYMQCQPDSGQNRNGADFSAQLAGPTLDYKVKINTTGEYRMWLRDIGFDGASDSVYVSIVELKKENGGSGPDWYRKAPTPNSLDLNDLNGGLGWDGDGGADAVSGDAGGDPMVWTISKPGVYTVRIYQREDGNCFDTFCFQLRSKPDPTPNIPESLIDTGVAQPLSVSVTPDPDAKTAPYDKGITVIFVDGTTKLAANSATLELDGVAVTATSSKQGDVTTVSFVPAAFFAPGSSHAAKVSYKDDKSASFSKNWAFTVVNYNLLKASWAVQPDTSKKGFLVRTWQSTGQPNNNDWTEEQLRGLHGDNTIANPTIFKDKVYGNSYYAETGTINYWNTGGQGNFTNNDTQDTPGLANDGTNDDNYSLEIITAIDLPAGQVKMGVNSDDGFRVYAVGSGDPRDAFSTVLGQFNGGRGVANTDFTFVVEKAGVYPFRMIYEEGGGDSAVEWYSVDSTGARHLINDGSDAKALKAYRSAPAGIYVESVSPGIGGQAPDATPAITAVIVDGARKVATSSVKLTLDGAAIAATATKAADKTTATFKSTSALAEGSKHTVTLTYADDATPPNSRTVTWSFGIPITTKTFVAGTLFIEAEDVDYGHGKYVKGKKIGMDGAYPGDAYNGLGTADDKGFDWNTNDNAGQAYRPDTGIAAGKANGSAGDERGLFQVTSWWTLGWNDGGEWYNYTRDFPTPAKDYEVYGHLSSGGAAINIRVDQITAGQGQADAQQVKKVLGYFKPGRATAGWDTLEIFRMTDADGNPITVNLGGNTTLRTTILAGSNSDQDYFAFVPATAAPPSEKPKISSIKSDGKNVTLEWAGTAVLQAADDVSGPWADVAGAGSGKAIAISGSRKFYRLKR